MTRARLRDLGITIGVHPTGPHNAITDVPGVWVGHRTLIYDEPRIARTGVTVIVPREGDIWNDNAFAGFHSFNGCGESILNALTAAETTAGYQRRTAHALPLEALQEVMRKYRPVAA